MRRLYWCRILAATHIRYNGEWRCQLVVDYQLHNYHAESLEDLYQQIKADGWQVWGYKDYLDYYHPRNALEYLMLRDVLRARGVSDDEIETDYLIERKERQAETLKNNKNIK